MTNEETIRSFLERDHARLDRLLSRAAADPGNIDVEGRERRDLTPY